jgi:uncharacterized protein (TIGR04255 family)
VSPEVPRKHPKLARAPLASVVAQVRFPPVFALNVETSRDELLAALQHDLVDYPLFARLHGQEILLGPQGVQSAESKPTSFQFSSDDGVWNVGISGDSLSLQTTQYDHFNDFVNRWTSIAEAVKNHLSPPRQLRLGLRYIDELRAEGADTPDRWQNLLAPEVIGLASSQRWGPATRQSFQEWLLEVDDVRCTVRHGFLPTAVHSREPFYLLDTDCHVDEVMPFEPDAQARDLDRFNDIAYELFRSSLEDDFYEGLGPERPDE